MWRRMRSSIALIVVLAMMLSVLPTRWAAAAEPALTNDEALAALQEYGIVRGDPDGSLRLNDNLTRAQAATIFVRSANAEDLAKMIGDTVPFWDAKGHWGAGEIAMAARMGLMKGDPTGLFRPEDNITYAEVLTVLLRMVEQEPTGPWDPDTIFDKAKSLGIAPAGVTPRAAATRGPAFWALASTMINIPVESHANLMRKFIDQVPPTLTVDRVTSPTNLASVTISGSVVGARQVLVDGRAARLDHRTGEFSQSVNLEFGQNNIVVEAIDWAKNRTTRTVTVERRANISRINIKGPSALPVRTSQKLEIEALDTQGKQLPLEDIEVSLTGDVATFNLATKTLTTGSKTGRGTLTLRSGSVRQTYTFDVLESSDRGTALEILEINSGRPPVLGKATTVTVRVLDENGRVVTDDYFRTITIQASGLSGVTISPTSAKTEKGIVTFSVTGTREGMATLTASSTGLGSVSRDIEFMGPTRIVLTPTPKSLKPDGIATSTIRASLVDENGRAITNNSSADIQIELRSSGTDGDFTDLYLAIPRGRSNSSGNDAVFQAGIMPGIATITGVIVSDHKYPIQTLSLPVNEGMTGAKLDVTYSPLAPKPGDAVTVSVRVLDSSNRLVTTGSYAFQIKLVTSNNDRVVNGIPEGVSFSFRNSAYVPVDDGRKTSDPLNDPMSIIGRTDRGLAEMTLVYDRSGTVTVTPVTTGATYEAYHPNLGIGPAAASTGLYVPGKEISFAGTPSKVILTADSSLGKDQPGGAVSSATQVVVRAKVVDSYNNPIPGYRQTVTLSRKNGDGVSQVSSVNRRLTTDGVAEFTVQASGTAGWDQYVATVGTFTSEPLTITVNRTKLLAPEITAIRGVKEGGLSPVTGYVGPDADYMDIQLAPMDPMNLDEPTNFAIAKVYRKGESRAFYTSEAIDLMKGLPTIRIPRNLLKTGTYFYEVQVNNAAGDSPKSLALDEYTQATVVDYTSTYKLTRATYDATTGKLTLTGSGLISSGNVDLSKISLVNGTERVQLRDSYVTVSSITSSTIVLLLGAQADEVTPERFHGAKVYVEAHEGWFTNKDGTQFAEPFLTVPVTPMATIISAAFDVSGQRLYIDGDGLKQGTLNLALVELTDGNSTVKLRPGSTTSYDRLTSSTDSQLVISLSKATYDALVGMDAELGISAETGWLYTGSGSSAIKVGAVAEKPVYMRILVTSAVYNRANETLTLRGSNLLGTTVHPGKLVFRRSTTGPTISLTKSSSVTATSETEIVIHLDPTDAASFLAEFSGRNVYMNTAAGWMEDALGRPVQPLADYSVLFTVPSK